MTDDERRNLRTNFTPTWLLDAVGDVDTIRTSFNDREGSRPPAIREKLLRLHVLAMEVHRGYEAHAREFFELAAAVEDEFCEAAESLERIQRTLSKLVDLYPESVLNEAVATA